VRSLDANHMISVGDEGFACNDAGPCPGAAWWCDCSSGVSSARFAAAPDVSYVTAHLYPESWGTDAAWGAWWVADHAARAHALAVPRPFVLEEFGISGKLAPQHDVYANWTATALAAGADGWHVWMTVGLNDGAKSWYGGDSLNIVCPVLGEPPVPPPSDALSCATLSAAARAIAAASSAAAARLPSAQALPAAAATSAAITVSTSGYNIAGKVSPVPFVANETRGGEADLWWDVMVPAMNPALPVSLDITYEWLGPPRNCPFVSAIDNVWCYASPPLCWEVYVNGQNISGGLVNATAPAGANVSWVYAKY